MKLKYLLTAFGFLTFLANAQVAEECGQPALTRMLWDKHPELEDRYYEFENQLKEMANPLILKDGEEEEEDILPNDKIAIIPVVFHVLHEYESGNISDEQIKSAIDALNRDFRKQNPGVSEIIPPFQAIAADAKIEFRLATIDPFGNPTNGVTRHFTSETNIGDMFSKLEQWPRGRYLNIWVSNYAGGASTLGYSQYPTDVEGGLRFMDGVMMLHNATGEIGTAQSFTRSTLTHEVGHWLNLAHTWGPTNDPGLPQNCTTDDGVDDTPNTIGWWNCNDLWGKTCDTLVDNIQNYMEYAGCRHMFTDGQVQRMRNALRLEVSQRSNLWTDENLALSIPEGQTPDPVADFFVDYQTNKERLVACVGQGVKFKNWSWSLSGVGTPSYAWTFEDGSEATSTAENPTISFTSPGWKTVSLTVEDNGRSHTITKDKFIWIAPEWAPFSGNVLFDFDDNPDYWVVQNPQNNPYQWQVRDNVGVGGSGGIFLNTSNPHVDPVQFSDEYFFNERRGGVKSAFVSQPISLSYMSDVTVSFDYACATDGTTSEEISEELSIYTSTDCGESWQLRKKLSGSILVNNGSGWDSFYPNNNSIWSNASFTLPNSLTGNMMLRFVYTGSDLSNNIAIDNISVAGTLGIGDSEKAEELTVYPNPSSSAKGWNVNYNPTVWGGASVKLYDVTGKIVSELNLPNNQSEVNIKPKHNTAKGIYFLRINNTDKVVQQKLILNK